MIKRYLTPVLVVTGMVLTAFPILAPILLTAIVLSREGIFRFDYLMPAELFPLAFLGGALLLWAALRFGSRWRGLLAWSLGVAVGALIGAQGVAVLTGLASGEVAPIGWQWWLVLTSLGIYLLALLAMATGGILLSRQVFQKS